LVFVPNDKNPAFAPGFFVCFTPQKLRRHPGQGMAGNQNQGWKSPWIG